MKRIARLVSMYGLGLGLFGCSGDAPQATGANADAASEADGASPDTAPGGLDAGTAADAEAPDTTSAAPDGAEADTEGPEDAAQADAEPSVNDTGATETTEAPQDADVPEDSAVPAEDASWPDPGDASADATDPAACLDDRTFFATHAAPLLEAECAGCHSETGLARTTRYRLGLFGSAEAIEANRISVNAFLANHEGAPDLFWQKPTSTVSHGGGKRFDVLDPETAVLREVAARALTPGQCDVVPPTEACVPGRSSPGSTPLRRLTDQQFAHAVRDLLGVEVPDGLFPRTIVAHGFRTFADNNRVSAVGAEQIMLAAEAVGARINPAALSRCEPAPQTPVEADACDRATLARIAERAFRRPPTPEELALVTRHIGTGLPRALAFRHAIEQLLQLPQFLYVDAAAGAPVDGSPGVRHLTDHAIAARLGLLFLDSLPDAPLLEAASEGRLHTRAEVHAAATRLVADPRTTRAIVAFHDDWLRLGRLEGLVRDRERYPDFEPSWVAALRTEARLFATEVLWGGDARFETLLGSRTTWVDASLAGLYGVPAPEGGGWARVTLPADRVGALTRAGFLSAHAYSATSAPVRRGAWVLEQLLCEELNPPPGVNMELPKEDVATPTIRERLEAHWTDPTCAACHVRLDPAGFAFEHYGALGERRETWENGFAIDASGALEDPAVSFDSAPALIAALRDSPRARACYARRWFEYAVGRPAQTADACTLRTLSQRFEASRGDIRRLVVDVTLTDAFLHRLAPEVQP
jgi:hypothetical protein